MEVLVAAAASTAPEDAEDAVARTDLRSTPVPGLLLCLSCCLRLRSRPAALLPLVPAGDGDVPPDVPPACLRCCSMFVLPASVSLPIVAHAPPRMRVSARVLLFLHCFLSSCFFFLLLLLFFSFSPPST